MSALNRWLFLRSPLLFLCFIFVPRVHGDELVTTDKRVIGMSSNGHVLAVRTPTQIVVMKVKVDGTKSTLEPRFHFPFPSSETNKWANAFHLLPDNRLFLCAQKTCTLYELDLEVGAEKILFETTFDLTIGSWGMVPLPDRFVLRTVSDENPKKAYVTTLNFQGEQLALAKDEETITHLNGAFGFQTADHYFFLDTVVEGDLHVYNYVTRKTPLTPVTRARLTRVCKNDATKDLITRMEIHLGCGPRPADYRQLPRLAVSDVFLSNDNQTLFVGFARQDASQLMCSYSMQVINDYFEQTWNDCQNIRNNEDFYAACPNDLPCYTFSWKINSKEERGCRRYRKDLDTQTYRNCEIGGDLSTLDRIGWLENFLPLWKNHEANYTGVSQYGGYEQQTFFVVDANGTLQRLLHDQPYASASWSTPASSFATASQKTGEKEVPIVLYALENQVGSQPITCAALYENCSAIRWDDPLGCAFCSFPAAPGFVTSSSENRTCVEAGGRLLQHECPPKIVRVTILQNQFHIVMENVEQFENVHVQICDNEVNYERTHNVLQGSLEGLEYDDDCEVIVYGDLRSASDFAIKWAKDGETTSQTASPSSSAGRKTKVVVGVIAAVVFIVIIAVIGYAIWDRRRATESEEMSQTWELPSRMLDGRDFADAYKTVSTTESETQLSVLYDIVKLHGEHFERIRQLGKGNFGRVFLCRVKGKVPDEYVAVKEIEGELHSMHQELRLIGQCHHQNIVQCHGYYHVYNTFCVVMEYLGGGDLHQLLISDKEFLVGDALSFVQQIANGMVYLASKNIIHRDLAARNCMLSEDHKIVKITDFGLGRKANDGIIYTQLNMDTKLPFRWTALECLQVDSPQFSEKTDVWSFGVVVWETFSRALMPYPNISKMDAVLDYLLNGGRLEQPAGCTKEIYDLMCSCWRPDPAHRPSFTLIYRELGRIIDEMDDDDRDEYYATYLTPRPVSTATSSTVTSRNGYHVGYPPQPQSPSSADSGQLKKVQSM
ncbi:Tyrosine-protein kinase receptor svh-2 [Aphelenchoides fujianensis]|nr:Tyrosine-protein kinase receptor svh-2 [Aphelenchoides fujianensis]